MKKQSLFKKVIRIILIVLASLWMLFEDWVWDSILAVMEKVGRLKVVRTFETFLGRQNKYLLLSLFVFPFFIMIPAKLFGIYLIAKGMVIRGISIFVIAKAIITALVTRLFVISKDKLLLIKSFAAFYFWMTEKKEWLQAEVRKLRAWQLAREFIRKLKDSLKLRPRPRKKR